jgi:1-pyrroline-5-carboxylate dehydrogenase
MLDGTTNPPRAINEPVLNFAPGSPEIAKVTEAIAQLRSQQFELPMTIGGERRMGARTFEVREPHETARVLGIASEATHQDAQDAIDAALAAAPAWRELPFDARAAVFLKAADLLAGPWRYKFLAGTMLGQSKTVYQAEIDAACELIDFFRFNVSFAREILAQQPISSSGIWNRMDHRPLEGFVYAITPFNFTAIAGNLPTAPALMGNVVVWKPAPTQMLTAHFIMELLEAAGLPAGVINLVSGDGIAVSEVALASRDLAGIHFTGSTGVFQHLWREVGQRISTYKSYPRLVGETGGKDFVVVHSSADPDVARVALIRGAFEYQGQKCSAASRAYVARSVWNRIKDDLIETVSGLKQGTVTDYSNFMSAVIDEKSFNRNAAAIDRAHAAADVTVLAGGTYDKSEGWFIRPTLIESTNPEAEWFTTEYFGPFLAVQVFDDADYEKVVAQMESVAPYALTGAVIAQDRRVVEWSLNALRFAAGNFYINDKPTGAVVGQQPFGGGRASGTNDKAGAPQNLLRWTSPRSLKETLVPPTDHLYPHMR